MRTKVLLCTSILMMLLITPNMTAQKKKPSKDGIRLAKSLSKEIDHMIDHAGINIQTKSACDPVGYLNILGKDGLLPKRKILAKEMDKLKELLTNYKLLKINPNFHFRIMEANVEAKSYDDFVTKLYNKDVGDLKPKTFSADVNRFYLQLQNLKQKGFVFDKRTVKRKECTFTIAAKLNLGTWKGEYVPKDKFIVYDATISGNIEYNIVANCNCKGKSTTALKSAEYKYTKPTELTIRYFTGGGIKMYISAPKKNKSLLTVFNVLCCTKSDINFEDPGLEISPTENISLPNQTIGAFGGIGFSQDFEETTLCVGGEYLYNITELGNSPLFVGANVLLENTSFMDVNNTWVGLGPTVQLFSPITPSGETQVTNGVSANYIFGSNDNGASNDRLTGFDVSINSGVNIQLSENLSAAIILPVLQYQNISFEAENGEATFEQSSTSLFVGKDNPVRLGLRFGF